MERIEFSKEVIVKVINEYINSMGIEYEYTIDEIGDLYKDHYNSELSVMTQYPHIYLGEGMVLTLDGKIVEED